MGRVNIEFIVTLYACHDQVRRSLSARRRKVDAERRNLKQREQELMGEDAIVTPAALEKAKEWLVVSRKREAELANKMKLEEKEVEHTSTSSYMKREPASDSEVASRDREEEAEERSRQERAEREQASRLEAGERRREEEQRRSADQGGRWFKAIRHARDNRWRDIEDLWKTVSPRRRRDMMRRPLEAKDRSQSSSNSTLNQMYFPELSDQVFRPPIHV